MSHTSRRAKPSDGAGIATVYLRSTAKLGFLRRCHDAEDMWRHFIQLHQEQEIWVTVEAGRIAAFLALTPGWIEHLYVHPAHQNKGIGQGLVSIAKQSSADGLNLWTFQQNAGAQKFYEQNGFRPDLVTDGRRNEERLPDIRYTWTNTNDT
ncbi:MAG: GNAT family N-acetyltransferase [Rhodobiaceae bacterium]|nr:MAG: GNAT family N-acetyltransferase [Rhodobiaceae bacterium]